MRLIALDIRSLHNVGSLFRSADAFGVEKLYLVGITGVPPRKEIAKTALGSEHRVLWEQDETIEPLLETLKQEGFMIAALETGDRSVSLSDVKIDPTKTVLIVGNEVDGIQSTVLDQCDLVVNIPTIGMKKSLNVSVAAGIALFAIQSKIR